MAESTGTSFFHVVIGDFIHARERVEKENTPTNRRDVVRAAFSAIEGVLWQVKQHVLRTVNPTYKLSPHEIAALLEETYMVTNKGDVSPQPRFLPTATSIRLVAGMVQRYRDGYELDFSHQGWDRLQRAIDVRNRIVHPKKFSDLNVSDDELNDCSGAFAWFLAFAIEAMHETNKGFEARAKLLSQRLKLGPETPR